MSYEKIRLDTIKTLNNYVEKGWQPGGFLTSVLSNDLMGACLSADPGNFAALREICMYVHWEMPAECHGNAERVNIWLNKMAGRKAVTSE